MVAGGVGLHHAGATHDGMVGHLQAIGHVAGETHVEHGGADAAVLDNIDDLSSPGGPVCQPKALPGSRMMWSQG